MMKVSTPLFQLKILVHGKPVQEYHKDALTFVEGRAGSEFELELTNLTDRRILVHPTVDGISCMDGKLASKNDNKHGYVLRPHESHSIPGWRLNDSEVAKFFFAGGGESYAEKTGRGEDKGVIACAVWEEKQYEVSYRSGGRGCGMTGGLTTCRASRVNNLGAGFGERSDHAVRRVSFEAATLEPQCVAVIYYDDRRGLQARGIKLSKKHGDALPNPFPRDAQGCPPPEGWRG